MLRHTDSWEEVHKYVDSNLKVWGIKANQAILPSILPWIESCFEEQTFARVEAEEGIVLFVNLPSMGVVSAMKKKYCLQLITGLLTARPNNSVCVVIHANRASESKQKKFLGIIR